MVKLHTNLLCLLYWGSEEISLFGHSSKVVLNSWNTYNKLRILLFQKATLWNRLFSLIFYFLAFNQLNDFWLSKYLNNYLNSNKNMKNIRNLIVKISNNTITFFLMIFDRTFESILISKRFPNILCRHN